MHWPAKQCLSKRDSAPCWLLTPPWRGNRCGSWRSSRMRTTAFPGPGRAKSASTRAGRSLATVEALGRSVLPMTWDVRDFARLGLLHELISGVDADRPSPEHIGYVKTRLAAASADIRRDRGDLTRLNSAEARVQRAASVEVRRRMA